MSNGSGTVQFFAGTSPSLMAGDTYTIEVQQSLTPAQPSTPYSTTQSFTVSGPEFTIDSSVVQSFYPPNGGNDQYDSDIPYIVLSDVFLPWERTIVPQTAAVTPPQPWLALVVFAEDEITIDPETNSPLTTVTVSAFVEQSGGTGSVISPTYPEGFVPQAIQSTQCQILTIPAETFQNVMPQSADLAWLAHTREMTDVPGEPSAQVSVIMANRLPISTTSGTTGTTFYAHLVSLEGLGDYIGPSSVTAPTLPVQMVSLFNWSFVSLPQSGVNFEQLATNLAATETPFSLPVTSDNTTVAARIDDGYVALNFNAFVSRTFAWYRGPFSPVVPQPVPVGSLPANSDTLLIYLAGEGIFDASYAAAWNIGRAIALSNGTYTKAMLGLRTTMAASLTTIAQRMAMPHFEGVTDPRVLAAPLASRRRFFELMKGGLGSRWDDALGAALAGAPPRHPRRPPHKTVSPRALLEREDVIDALVEAATPQSGGILSLLASLAVLEGVPFSHLVPNQQLLPAESIRFFYVDVQWIEALLAGALSLGIGSSLDLAIHNAVVPRLLANAGVTPQPFLAGMLICSQLVSDWAALNLTADATILRDDVLAPSVRLCLFAGIPTTVTLAQPYHGLQFGAENNVVTLRSLTAGSIGTPTGSVLPSGNQTFAGAYCAMRNTGVISVSQLASDVTKQMGTIDAGDFAIQMVLTPESQSFESSS